MIYYHILVPCLYKNFSQSFCCNIAHNYSCFSIFLSNLSFCYEKMLFVQLSKLIKEQHQNKPYCWYYIAEA